MDLDDQLRRHFGTADLSAVAPGTLEAGIDRMLVELGLERDRGRRFALWALLYTLGGAPDLETTFSAEEDRNAARDFMDFADRPNPG